MFAMVDEEDFHRLIRYNWYADKDGYARANVKVKGRWTKVIMSRLILGCSPDKQVDHINGDITINCRSNLRICTRQQNGQNRKKPSTNKSGYKGVSWHKNSGKWRARITTNNKWISMGSFVNREDAAMAYDFAAIYFFGEFARLNFP